MPVKTVWLDDSTKLQISKRRSSRNIKLSINSKGEVRISIPRWTPYSAAVAFAKSRYDWIRANLPDQKILENGQLIGRSDVLHFLTTQDEKISTRLLDGIIQVKVPEEFTISSPNVQAKAHQACIRALRRQAEYFLPERVSQLAGMYGYDYSSVKVRQLRGRWGSCDQHKNITLNLFLMNIPDTEVDYVILHELAHTRVHNHGPDFWQEMTSHLANAKQIKKQLRQHQPSLNF